jgi:hypothetical protein
MTLLCERRHLPGLFDTPNAPPAGSDWRRLLHLAAPALLLACALFLPFVNKAYTIDDPHFLLQARQIRHEFLRPLNYSMCWFDSFHCGPVYRMAPGSALMGYFLLPVITFTTAEPAIHLMQLMVLFAAVIGTVSLALRLGGTEFEARGAGALLVAFPPVICMTNTVMPDVLVLALGVIGIERFYAWLEDGKVSTGAVAAICLGLAPFGRLQALGMIGVAATAAYLHGAQRGRVRDVLRGASIVLGSAMALFLGLTLLTRESGVPAALPPAFNISLNNVERNTRAILFYYVVCFPVTGFWLVKMRRHAAWLILAAGALFGMLISLNGLYRLESVVWSLTALSALCIALLLWRDARARSPHLALVLWLLVPCVALPYIHVPPKLVMIAAPAAAIVGLGLLRDTSPVLRRRALWSAVVVCAAGSVLLSDADLRFSDLPRQAAAQLVAPAVRKGERVWYAGQWGIYWYAAEAGATLVVPGVAEPGRGDLLLTEQFDHYRNPLLDRYPTRRLVAERVFGWTGGRVMSFRHPTGLYSNVFGPLPWTLGSGEVDRFELWRIR